MDPFTNPLHHFEEFNEEIFTIYDRESLRNLSQIPLGKNTLDHLMHDILRKKNAIHPLPYSVFKLQDEMNFISRDIKYIAGILYFLRPYIVDTDEAGGKYIQNLPDRRYVMYANFGYSAIYNFWDRIGDLLHLYFETGLPLKDVYLGRVLNNIKPIHKNNQFYVELNEIYENKLKPFFGDRNDTIHHYQLENRYYWGALENRGNQSELSRLNTEKHSLPEVYKEHLELSFRGFELALRLIDTLPDDPTIPVQPHD